jgi:uncharacterized phage protein gp47/JayE
VADIPTQRDLFLVGRQEGVLLPTRFTRAIIDTLGSDINTIIQIASAMGEEGVRFLQAGLNELTLANSKGEALDRLVYDLYQLSRKEATNAIVPLELTRTNTVGFTVAAGSRFGTVDGITFATLSDVAFGAGELGPFTVNATADITGVDGNVGEGSISQVITTAEDSTLAVTNPSAASGGTEQESDDDLRARARDFFVTARRGTRAAIEFGALQADRVAQATAVETLDQTTGLPGCRVQLYVSDPNGQANTALTDEVVESLDEYRALGVPVLVIPAVPQYVTIVASGLQFESGANTSQVLDDAANALVAFINATPPGEILRRADLHRVLAGVSQLIVPDGSLSEPAGDLVPTTGTVIRTTRDRVALSG